MSTATESPSVGLTTNAVSPALVSIEEPQETAAADGVSADATTSTTGVAPNNSTNSAPSSPSRLFAASRQQASSAAQQAPVILRKKAATLVSRLFPPAFSTAQGRRVGNSSRTSIATESSRTNSQRTNSDNDSATGGVASNPSAPDAANPDRTMAPLPYKSLDHHPAWAAPWRRFRTPPSPSRFTAPGSPSFSTTTGESTDFISDDDNVEEVVLFESLSLLSPSASSIREEQLMAQMNQRPKNALQWLSTACPTDVLPHILAYCGPQTTAKLRRVNKFWFRTVEQEATWKVLCQDLYKWKPGDEEPSSWKEFYINNPCVPVDYKSIHGVLQAHPEQNVHIWMRPGRYYLKESLDIGHSPQQKFSISTMKLPDNVFLSPADLIDRTGGSATSSPRRKRRGQGIMKFIMCTAASYNDAAVEDESVCSEISELDGSSLLFPVPQRATRATLVLRTRKQNEPVFRVRQGHFNATNLNIEHYSGGSDIWNGNAAIQIQPPQPDQEGPPPPLRRDLLPVAQLTGLRVTSRTGRGVVTIDGGQLTCTQTRVYDCAATGIYVGGRGTRARVVETDVLRCGLGSRSSSRRNAGIARGHSGVYLEQGVVDIIDCNVSNNTLTGITAVSNENSTLNLTDSDLLGNGSFQLEIPSRNARGIHMRQNRLESQGTGRIRATLAPF
eukprot:CAMPEP_0172446726 /NCGR_PEP_ID=MMETSP1065-20121228/6265_1 /TAXON_ID=265537 /ORGANISM="Amphiprora paludosa, Strain CCMP125" /LENGTH=670 /DNA_ID=CAMNT_0013197915 /DNA_START=9 /DNA_END=2021 /DNA_ORIENTATION=+